MSLSAAAAILACQTDNGDNRFGPDIGDLPDRDAGRDARRDGTGGGDEEETTLPDGARADTSQTTSCGRVAVLAGNEGSLTGAVQDDRGAFVVAPIAGGAAKSKPAITAFGSGFLAVTRGIDDQLQWVTSVGTAGWSAVATAGGGGVKGGPSLAVLGTKAHLVYSGGPGANTDFIHGIFEGSSWNAVTDKVGNPGSFGTVSAALAATTSEVAFAENGGNFKLYARTYATEWSGSTEIPGANTKGDQLPTTPELAAITGTNDLVLVWVDKDSLQLSFAVRNAGTKEWANKGRFDPSATPFHFTTEQKFGLVRTGATKLMVLIRGQDGNGYASVGTVSGDTVAWEAPLPITGTQLKVDGVPAAATGVCGDDAVFAYAAEGAVSVVRLKNGSWSTPEPIPGLNGKEVGIATRP